MNKQNKLARNAIRARKAQKKRANEQDKPKKGKRWLTRIFSLVGCLLLVSALAVPCFADETDYSNTVLFLSKNAILNDLNSNSSPLYKLLSSKDVYELLDMPYFWEFNSVPLDYVIDAPELLTYDFNNGLQRAYSIVYSHLTGVFIETGLGYWTSNYTSSGTNRIIFFKFNEYVEESTRVAFQIRVSFDNTTGVVNSATVSSSVYPIDGTYSDYTIGCVSNIQGSSPLYYAITCGFVVPVMTLNYVDYLSGWIDIEDDAILYGYQEGYSVGYYDGFQDGQSTGYQKGFQDAINGLSFDSVSYGNVIDEFNKTLLPWSDTSSYGSLLSYYNGFGDSRFLTIKTLVSGTGHVSANANYLDQLRFLNSMNGGSITAQIDLDYFDVTLNTDTVVDAFGIGYVEYSQIALEGYQSRVSVAFYDDGNVNPLAKFNYSVVADSSGQNVTFETLYLGDVAYTPEQITDFEVAFAVNNIATQDMLPTICALLFLDDMVYYEDVVYSPLAFNQGYSVSYNLGYDDGNRYGYQNGYDDGYSKGTEEGTGGADYDAAFKDGYNEAVRQIDSGDFGENFLGNLFSAPLRALNKFVIVSTPAGIDITVGGLLSACIALGVFLAFLKMVRGG